jgi:HTH-type transcriptional regulator/antitoxin HigA
MAAVRGKPDAWWSPPPRTGAAMSHLLDPSSLDTEAAYVAALDELEDLMLADPGTPGGRRFDELVALIEAYEARRDGYDLQRMKQLLASVR